MEELVKSRLFWFVVGVMFVSLAAVFISYVTNKSLNKKLFLANVIAERSQWRKQFREEVSAFSALAMKHYFSVKDLESHLANKQFALNIHELNQLRVKVRLRLNPNETIDSYDTKLIRTMRRVIIHFETQHYDRLDLELLRIERCAQRILKKEWEKSKREVISGKMEKSH